LEYKRSLRLLLIATLIPLTLFLLLFSSLAALLANGQFEDSGQKLGGDMSFDVGLADLDGDGDLDVFTANRFGNRVWINQGGAQNGDAGIFLNSGQSPGLLDSRGVALGDVDGNQTIDAFVVNNGEREVWLNNGLAQFSLDQQLESDNSDGQDVALGFLNGDKALDAFVVNHGPNEVWLNDGQGGFSQAQDDLGSARSKEVALGDLNGDGAVDAYVANGSTGAEEDEIWVNNGAGVFTRSNQTLDFTWNEGVALGDLDGDGQLEVFVQTFDHGLDHFTVPGSGTNCLLWDTARGGPLRPPRRARRGTRQPPGPAPPRRRRYGRRPAGGTARRSLPN